MNYQIHIKSLCSTWNFAQGPPVSLDHLWDAATPWLESTFYANYVTPTWAGQTQPLGRGGDSNPRPSACSIGEPAPRCLPLNSFQFFHELWLLQFQDAVQHVFNPFATRTNGTAEDFPHPILFGAFCPDLIVARLGNDPAVPGVCRGRRPHCRLSRSGLCGGRQWSASLQGGGGQGCRERERDSRDVRGGGGIGKQGIGWMNRGGQCTGLCVTQNTGRESRPNKICGILSGVGEGVGTKDPPKKGGTFLIKY